MTTGFSEPAAAKAAGRTTTTPAALDEKLIAQISDGDRLAMRNLYLRHERRVFRFILRIVGDRCLAEEVMSEVFFDVWKKAAHFAGRSSVSTWLLGIARHKALTAAAAKSRRYELLEGAAMSVADPSADLDEAMLGRERGTLLRRSLGALSPEHREVIDLVYYQEKTIKEIVGLLGIPENTVKTRMFYARKRLAALVETDGADRPAVARLH
jgi:RNA polymerase sigma-70 factor (ECF subfamily)